MQFMEQRAGSLVQGVSGAHWSLWLTVLTALILFVVGFRLLRWLHDRGWRSLRTERAVWMIELIVLPLAIWMIGALLGGLDTKDRVAQLIGLGTGIVLCFTLAWLADRGISLFLLPRGTDGRSIEVPRILRTGISIAVYAFAIVAAFVLVLDQDTIGFVVSGSVVLGILGLALQGVLQDTFAGVAISIDEPYRLGDWVELEDGKMGQVLDISWRSTRLYTWEHGVLVVPNSRMASSRIHNHTQRDSRHGLLLSVYLPNEVDPELARRLLLEALLESPEVLDEPAPSVSLAEASGRPYRYLLFAYCADYYNSFEARSSIHAHVWRKLQAHGLELVSENATDARLQRTRLTQVREENIGELLHTTPLFRLLTDDERATLVGAAAYRTFPPEATVVREDEEGDSLFLIAGGQVDVTTRREGTPIARLGSGEYFGEMSLLTGTPRSATVRTLTRCALLEIDKDALMPILQARPELGEELARMEARRQLELEQALQRGGELTEADIGKRARQLLQGMRRFLGV